MIISTLLFYNWWSTYINTSYSSDFCAAIIIRSELSTEFENRWVPFRCDKKLPFVCKVAKGITWNIVKLEYGSDMKI